MAETPIHMRLDPMPSPLLTQVRTTRLLAQAYQLIREHQHQSAEEILDALLSTEPQNVEAWEAYMQLRRDRSELLWLKERVLHTPELSENDKNDILSYHEYLLRKLAHPAQDVKTPVPVYAPPTQINVLPNHNFEITTQENFEYSHPRTIVFEYAENFSQLEQKTLQPIHSEKQKSKDEVEIIVNSKYLILAGVIFLFLMGIRLVTHQNFFGYWVLFGSALSFLYWTIHYSNGD